MNYLDARIRIGDYLRSRTGGGDRISDDVVKLGLRSQLLSLGFSLGDDVRGGHSINRSAWLEV